MDSIERIRLSCLVAECHCTAGHVAGRKGSKEQKPASGRTAAEHKAAGAGASALASPAAEQQDKKPRRRFLFLRRRQKPTDAGEAGSVQQVIEGNPVCSRSQRLVCISQASVLTCPRHQDHSAMTVPLGCRVRLPHQACQQRACRRLTGKGAQRWLRHCQGQGRACQAAHPLQMVLHVVT